jgi:hypothetical protein
LKITTAVFQIQLEDKKNRSQRDQWVRQYYNHKKEANNLLTTLNIPYFFLFFKQMNINHGKSGDRAWLWIGFYCSRYSSFQHSNEPPGSIKSGEFLDQLSNYKFLKKASAAWSTNDDNGNNYASQKICTQTYNLTQIHV